MAFSWPCETLKAITDSEGRMGGGRVTTGLQLERHPEATLAQTICQASHHTSHKPQQKTKLIPAKASQNQAGQTISDD